MIFLFIFILSPVLSLPDCLKTGSDLNLISANQVIQIFDNDSVANKFIQEGKHHLSIICRGVVSNI